jgi:hypothetical protein
MAKYPSDDHWAVKSLRFLNILDDQENKLSPTKVNLWAASLTGMGSMVTLVLAWVGQHTGMVNEVMSVMGPVGGWLAQAHVTHHYDKKLNAGPAAALRERPSEQRGPKQGA